MNSFLFKNKQEYLEYRSIWKQEYKKTSEEIRKRKWVIREWQRIYSLSYIKTEKEYNPHDYSTHFHKLLNNNINKAFESNPELNTLKQQNYHYSHLLLKLKEHATNMLNDLKLAKIEAQRQYLIFKRKLTISNNVV